MGIFEDISIRINEKKNGKKQFFNLVFYYIIL